MSRAANRTGVFLRNQLWIWPIIAVIVLSVIGFAIRTSIESTMKANLTSGLQTILGLETSMLEAWFAVQKTNAESLANDLAFRERIYRLMESLDSEGGQPGPEGSAESVDSQRQHLDKQLSSFLASHDFQGYFVADRSSRIIAASQATMIALQDVPEYRSFLGRVLKGETVVCPPFASVMLLPSSSNGQLRSGEPVMYVCTPIRDEGFHVTGALALQIQPEGEFSRILQLGRVGASGETFAFDKTGRMVSNSRFDDDLVLLGLLPDTDDTRSILNVLVRDPGVNLMEGDRPGVRRSQLPLTRMASEATQGRSGIDVDGYRDYRGVPVIGAWNWLPEYDIGVATEVDVAQAFRPLSILRTAFWSLYALLVISALAIFVFTLVVSRLRREARKAAVEAQQLGQYTLEHKLGSGGMGVVYKGQHAMLRRPTAIKLLDVEKVNDASVQRFEREVQITCKLNHPNTIAIYDYGRTPEGVFYYAMEYLDGIDLQKLVDTYGPQPESRVIHILLQICGSLYEAHSQGLVHRDIKPANIMLNRRGCEPDVVKVLDFGLVKALEEGRQGAAADENSLTGTPLYMSPEAIESPLSVDARSDIYAVGAVGYFLLTGTTVFRAGSLVELCRLHVDETPQTPSQRLGRPVSPELEHVLMSALEKSRAKRPQTARELAQLLSRCPSAQAWNVEAADAWWGTHERGQPPRHHATAPSASSSPGLDLTFVSNPLESGLPDAGD